VAFLVQYVAEEGRRQRGEQPEQGEGGKPTRAGGDELAPALLGDAQPGEAHGRPLTRAHGFWDKEQAQAGHRQQDQVHLEDQNRGMGGVLGEEPGDERAQAEAAHVGGCGDQGGPTAVGGRGQLAERGGRRAGHEARGEPGQYPPGH
jgi:hypothetical protein